MSSRTRTYRVTSFCMESILLFGIGGPWTFVKWVKEKWNANR